MSRAAFKAKRTDLGTNPDISPTGSRDVGIKLTPDGRSNLQGDPNTKPTATPFYEKPATTIQQLDQKK